MHTCVRTYAGAPRLAYLAACAYAQVCVRARSCKRKFMRVYGDHGCEAMPTDICIDRSMDICKDVGIDMFIDMCKGVCIGVC